jgi:hypothetical protein
MEMKTKHIGPRATLASVWARIPLLLTFFVLVFGLGGCQLGNDGNGDEETGKVVIGLTDAEGDFASYSVDVLSLTLTKANGAVVETVPMSTRVDFAQYTDMTEFLTIATIPSGRYVKASMVLDYSNADIWVENAAGDAVQVDPGNILDSEGNPITQLEVSVHLEDRNSLLIVPGVPAHLTLDFDLQASNTMAFDGLGVPTQTVEPFLLAELDVEKFKTHRLRGPLAEVDVNEGSFEIIVRPFHHLLGGGRPFGKMAVVTTNSTQFDIDGQLYEGQTGLVALDAKTALSAVIVMGEMKRFPLRFEATEVYAGSSVPGGDMDVVTGNVMARAGDVLTVKGATLVRTDGSVVFNDEVRISLGDMTSVRRQRSLANTYDRDDISVGQRVRIFGTLTNDSTTQLEMDAGLLQPGYVQMRYTTLRGTVADAPLVLALNSINGRRMALYDFSGSGDSPATDADPTHYVIDPQNLDVSGLEMGDPVRVRGFVTPYGAITAVAPEAFQAYSVIDVSALKALLALNWNPASMTAVENINADGLTLNLDGVGHFHHIVRGTVATDLAQASASTQVQPKDSGEGLYWISQNGSHQLHTSFANFTQDLAMRLATSGVKHVAATGDYDDATGVLKAGLMAVALN